MRRSWIRVPLSCLALSATLACPELNPDFVEDGSSGSTPPTGSTTSTTLGPTGSGPAEGTAGTAAGSSGTTTTADTSTTAPPTTSDSTTSTTTTAAASSTGDYVELGFACNSDEDCDPSIGAVCCTVMQCRDTCMVPCVNPAACPFADMGCAHGYCLFPCNDSDADCAMWPGYTCQHSGNTLCEL